MVSLNFYNFLFRHQQNFSNPGSQKRVKGTVSRVAPGRLSASDHSVISAITGMASSVTLIGLYT